MMMVLNEKEKKSYLIEIPLVLLYHIIQENTFLNRNCTYVVGHKTNEKRNKLTAYNKKQRLTQLETILTK